MKVYISESVAKELSSEFRDLVVHNIADDKEPVARPGMGGITEAGIEWRSVLQTASTSIHIIAELGGAAAAFSAAWKTLKKVVGWVKNRKESVNLTFRYTRPDVRWMIHIHMPENASWLTQWQAKSILKRMSSAPASEPGTSYVDINFYWDTGSRQFMRVDQPRE